MSPTKNEMIRKLGGLEQYFHDQIEQNGTVNATSFLFTSKLDLFANKDIVIKAVNLWKKTQAFLRSKVNSQEKCFAYASDDKLHNADNIDFLYYKSDNDSNEVDTRNYWKLLIEREYTIPINWEDGLLWRLMFIKLGQTETNEYEYNMLITASHAIFDGHSAFATIATLFFLIEGVYANKISYVKEIPVAPSMEEFVLNHLKENTNEIAEFNKIGGFKQPTSFIIKNPELDRQLYIPVDTLIEGAFYSDLNQSEYVNLKELVAISKDSVTKFHCTTFKGEQFKRFLAKSKFLNAKVTGVFNAMFIIAWRMVYEKLNNDLNAKSQRINYTTIVNLRPYLKESDHNSLVWLCNSLYSSYDKEIDYNQDEFWSNEFWKIAKSESESFHSRLKKGEQFRLHEALAPMDSNETRIHFGLSNLVVPNQITENLKLFKLNEVYTLSSYRAMWSNDLGYHNIVSIGDSLCWVMSYNSFFLKNEVAKLFIDFVMDIYNRISS